MKRISFLAVVISVLAFSLPTKLSAQYSDSISIDYGLRSVRTERWNPAAKIGLSVLGGQLYNMSFLHFDKYVLDAEYAQVTWESIRRNLNFGTGWDNDAVGINMVGHPFQGALDHLINRSLGLGFWSSLPLVFLESASWEMFYETEPPSPNDFFTTSWNGMVVGEVLWRVGNYIFCKPARKGVNFQLRAGTGIRTVTELAWSMPHPANVPSAGLGASLTIDMTYGDRLRVHNNAPLNFFDFHLNAAVGSGQSPISEFTLLSRLWGMEIETRKGEALFGIFDHMSTFLSESWTENRSPYRISEAASVGPGFVYSINGFTTGAYVAATIVGAGTTDYYDLYDRDYSFGSGYSVKSLNTYKFSDVFSLDLNFRHYQIFTWGGDKQPVSDMHYYNSMGDNGTTLSQVVNLRALYSPFKHISFELGGYFFHRNTFYSLSTRPSASSSHLTAEFGIRYKL